MRTGSRGWTAMNGHGYKLVDLCDEIERQRAKLRWELILAKREMQPR
jgi:hypothetical protein